MKKSLLLLAGVFAAASGHAANDPVIYENLMFQMNSRNGEWLVSDDGSGSILILDRINNKDYVYTADEAGTVFYSAGVGNCVSNNGIVLGTTTNGMMDASYWQNGEWISLPIQEGDTGTSSTQGITPDGKRICGNVGKAEFSVDATSIMCVPAVWTLGEDGKYGEYTILPHPELDFTGRVPQYITAVSISDDGKTVVGQIQDYAGMCPQPIVYTEGEDGKWEYTLLLNDQFHPEGDVWPTWPGDDSPTIEQYMTQAQKDAYDAAVEAYYTAYDEYQANKPQPQDYLSPEEKAQWEEAVANWDPYTSPFPPSATDFMTEEELAKYEADLNAWFAMGQEPNIKDYMTPEELAAYNKACEEYTEGEYPQPKDFMGADSLAKYNAAVAAWKTNPLRYPEIKEFISPEKYEEYQTDFNNWETNFDAFMEKYYTATETLPSFVFNNVVISPNGKYMANTSAIFDFWNPEDLSSTYIFDLENGKNLVKDVRGLVSWVGDEGQITTAAPTNNADRSSFITLSYDGEAIPFQDYIKEKNAGLYKWMEDNMRHDYYYYVWDEETETEVMVVEENKWYTGTVTPTSDMKTFISWTSNTWSEDFNDPGYYSYVLSIDYEAGLSSTVAESDIELSADANGNVSVKGQAANIAVYDMSGREVYRSQSPANTFCTGLESGMYIIKATDANGASKILKSAF